MGAGGGTAERETILSRRRNSYRFFGWRAGWRAISCQSACPGKGGPFIRNRLKARINKPCRRRFILHITSRPRWDDPSVFPVITKSKSRLLRGYLPVEYACWYAHIDIIRMLIQAVCNLIIYCESDFKISTEIIKKRILIIYDFFILYYYICLHLLAVTKITINKGY